AADLRLVLLELEGVDAGEVDELDARWRLADLVVVTHAQSADAGLLRGAGEVAGLVAQAAEPVEERGLARVRIPQEGDAAQQGLRSRGRRHRRRGMGGARRGRVHVAALTTI